MKVFAIIPAAGLGTRMSVATQPRKPGGVPTKQFAEIGGAPILLHTLRKFAGMPRIECIYVALRESEKSRFEKLLKSEKLKSRVEAVIGGDNRQASVANALAAVKAGPDDVVLIHDAVRPLVDRQIIESVIHAAQQHGAAIAGVPATDTIKQVERTANGALVTSTIPRERVVLAQTPQGFRYAVIRKAFDDATRDGFMGTDEASLAERAGFPVAVVMGSPRNLKITTPGDLELAEFFLQRR